ncbi:hypothetical protein EDB83DRAFT_2320822 [Lactarius deliciosus]|nr:hypothetical protein EDB83DRAFT_2320822 [Lactarius deliciosus]
MLSVLSKEGATIVVTAVLSLLVVLQPFDRALVVVGLQHRQPQAGQLSETGNHQVWEGVGQPQHLARWQDNGDSKAGQTQQQLQHDDDDNDYDDDNMTGNGSNTAMTQQTWE